MNKKEHIQAVLWTAIRMLSVLLIAHSVAIWSSPETYQFFWVVGIAVASITIVHWIKEDFKEED